MAEQRVEVRLRYIHRLLLRATASPGTTRAAAVGVTLFILGAGNAFHLHFIAGHMKYPPAYR